MRLALMVALLLLPLSAGAQPPECQRIERRSKGFVKCRYTGEQWRITYSPGAFSIVKASGRHSEMIQSLCNAHSDSVLEIIKDVFRKPRRQLVPCDVQVSASADR